MGVRQIGKERKELHNYQVLQTEIVKYWISCFQLYAACSSLIHCFDLQPESKSAVLMYKIKLS